MRSVGLKAAQCRANCIATFLHYNLCPPKVLETNADRYHFQLTDDFLDEFMLLVPIKFSPWNFVSNHGTTAECGWRENVPLFSMQLIKHRSNLLEADFDIGNPERGLGPLIIHGIEWLHNRILSRKTNPFRVMRALVKRGLRVEDVRIFS